MKLMGLALSSSFHFSPNPAPQARHHTLGIPLILAILPILLSGQINLLGQRRLAIQPGQANQKSVCLGFDLTHCPAALISMEPGMITDF